jgi:aminoglycoside phosphotransferase
VNAGPSGIAVPALPESILRATTNATFTRVDHGCNPGRVYRIDLADRSTTYLKIHPIDPVVSLGREADVIKWLSQRVRVPDVLGYEVSAGVEYLLLAALPGRTLIDPAVDDDWRSIARSLAKALRELHALDVSQCKMMRRLDDTLSREAAGDLDVAEVARWSSREDLVFTHGDACLPNFVIDDAGDVGYLDLARGGVGDRYLDLACAAHTLRYNEHPEEAVAAFFEAYDLKPIDLEKLDFYTRVNKLI